MLLSQLLIGLCCIFALLMLFMMICQNNVMGKNCKKPFLCTIFLSVFVVLCEIGTSYYELTGTPFSHAYVLFNMVGFSLSPFIALCFSRSFGNPRKKGLNLLLLPSLLNVLLSVLSPAFGFIFSVTPPHTYNRGSLFILFILAYLCNILYFLVALNRMIQRYQGEGKYILSILFLFILAGTSIQIYVPSVHSSWLCVTFSLILLYTYFNELAEKEDSLTTLFNRRSYETQLRCLEKRDQVIILFCDVDHFKKINDRYGHQYGDLCLKRVANCMKHQFATIGRCYRIGGDEFSVLIVSSEENEVKKQIAAFVALVNQKHEADPSFPTVSIGYAVYRKSDGSITQAVHAADREMYNQKQINNDHAYPTL